MKACFYSWQWWSMIRALGAACALVVLCASGRAQSAPELASVDEVIAALRAEESPTAERILSLRTVLDSAASMDPTAARPQIGLALVSRALGDRGGARDLARKAADLDPKSAEAWYWLGMTLFESISDASTLAAAGIAGDARDACLRAIELDPKHIGAREAVAEYYIEAPGIAGGSLRKAREQGNAILKTPGGEMKGHLVLARVAVEDDDWKLAASEYELARRAAPDEAHGWDAVIEHARNLKEEKDDPDAAVAMLSPIVSKLLGKRAITGRFMLAEALRAGKKWGEAQTEYERVIVLSPDARMSRFALGECFEKQKMYAEAAGWYTEFAERFPKDKRAEDAKERADECVRRAR